MTALFVPASFVVVDPSKEGASPTNLRGATGELNRNMGLRVLVTALWTIHGDDVSIIAFSLETIKK